jgi:hypothetical protein
VSRPTRIRIPIEIEVLALARETNLPRSLGEERTATQNTPYQSYLPNAFYSEIILPLNIDLAFDIATLIITSAISNYRTMCMIFRTRTLHARSIGGSVTDWAN